MSEKEGKLFSLLFDRFANDLWLDRCQKLGEILDHVDKFYRANKDNHQLDSGAQEWIQFIKFLDSQCSGRHFTHDKQWSELLNLMQISKRLNHRSARVKNIITNRHLIEANASAIRKLNESARLIQVIEIAIGDLDSTLHKAGLCLELSSSMLVNQTGNNEEANSANLSEQLLLNELAVARSRLKDRCQVVIFRLKLELEDDSIANESRLETWRAKIAGHETNIEKLNRFLTELHGLQANMVHLMPLMSRKEDFEGTDSNNKQLVIDSLAECKRIFNTIQEFHRQLMELLIKLASTAHTSTRDQASTKMRHKSDCAQSLNLALIKLLNSKSELWQSSLSKAFQDIEMCRKEMEKIMESLRIEFGRFYFINDFELLTVVSLDWRLVTECGAAENKRLICKLFNNSISAFILDESRKNIVGVESPLGEKVHFVEEPVAIRKPLNVYSVEIVRILNEIIRKLRRSLKSMLVSSLLNGNNDLLDWRLPIQLMMVSENVKFCQQIENAFGVGADETQKVEGKLRQVTSIYEERFLKLQEEPQELQGDSCLSWLKRSAVISLTVQFIASLAELQSSSISSPRGWSWQKQVRYYLQELDQGQHEIEVRMADAKFIYKFDFLPLELTSDANDRPSLKRLIRTQITERCFLVASQSVCHFKLGANPYGPAGGGKTETIKTLGHSLGCQVIVHNCDQSNDCQSLDRLIWGLAHTGLWGCFDEFNRLSAAALSTVSASLELVQTSLRTKQSTRELSDGRLVCVDRDSAFFVTLNPGDASKYRGRSRLPANLRDLFLPVAMVRVQIEPIVSENLLSLTGQMSARNEALRALRLSADEALELARKLAQWIEWMRNHFENLPQPPGASNRCEWDLRLVMATLRRLKLMMLELCAANNTTNMEQLLVNSLVCEVRPRLASHEEMELFSKSFEENNLKPMISSNALKESKRQIRAQIRAVANEMFSHLCELAERSIFEEQAEHLNNQLETRNGVLLLGPSQSGKSSIWRLLHLARQNKVKWLAINPRACERDALFGNMNVSNGKWADGLFTARVREAQALLQADQMLEQVWIVLDGPIEPIWVESLNSVLDDNQILTLSSGERLSFAPSTEQRIKLIFESTDLTYASPATVSRLGLVYTHGFDCSQIDDKNNHAHLVEGQNYDQLADMAKSYLFSKQIKILIVSGRSKLSTKRSFVRTLVNENVNIRSQIYEYNCHEYSNSTHLLDWLSSNLEGREPKARQFFMINNIHLIQPDDEWETKSFVELLRFVSTYGLYYDKNLALKYVRDAQFILCIGSRTEIKSELGDRTLSMASVVEVNSIPGKNENNTNDDIDFKNNIKFNDFFNELFATTGNELEASPVLTVSSPQYGMNRRGALLKALGSKWQVFEFRNTKMVADSLECLDELIDGAARPGRKKSLFILSHLEYSLMERQSKSRLMHKMNYLNLRPHGAKFIYLTHSIHSSNEKELWPALGQVIHFECKPSSLADDVRARLLDSCQSKADAQIDQRELDWLAKRLVAFIESCSDAQLGELQFDRRRFTDYLELVISLLACSKSELRGQRRTLTNGLSHLAKFEEDLERIRRVAKSEEDELREKKLEIEHLMRDIKAALDGAERQRDAINKLKSQLGAKSKETEASSRRLEAELSSVLPLVERSKAEIVTHLRPEALNEIKTLRAPPKTIKDILDVLFLLLGLTDSSWPAIKSHLASMGSLKDELMNYDFKLRLDEQLLARCDSLMESKGDSFDPQKAARASKAIVPILGWIQATLAYGRALIRVRPLNGELSNLKNETMRLREEMKLLEDDMLELDKKIESDSSRLSVLKNDYAQSEAQSRALSSQLNEAQRVRSELDEQINNWRHKLNSLASSLDGLWLSKLCLAGASVALFAGDTHFASLNDWFKCFELPPMTAEEFTANVFTCLFASEEGEIFKNYTSAHFQLGQKLVGREKRKETITDFKVREQRTILQLVCVKLCLALKRLVPFIDLGTGRGELSELELVDCLSFKSILCNGAKEVSVIRCMNHYSNRIDDLPKVGNSNKECDEYNYEWVRTLALELAGPITSQLNRRLVAIELGGGEPTAFHLDIIDCVLSSTNRAKLILVGQYNAQSDCVRRLVRPISLSTLTTSGSCYSSRAANIGRTSEEEEEEEEEIVASVMSCLVRAHYPELSESVECLEQAVRVKQSERHKAELALLQQLAKSTAAGDGQKSKRLAVGRGEKMTAQDGWTLIGETVRVLRQLIQLNNSLEVAKNELAKKQEEFFAKQREHSRLVHRAAHFYSHYLADLGQIDPFYHMSLDKFTQLLVWRCSNGPASDEGKWWPEFDCTFIASHAMLAMRPMCRDKFLNRLRDYENKNELAAKQPLDDNSLLFANSDVSRDGNSLKALTLKRTLLDLIAGKGTEAMCRLIVVLHDSTKSSPQFEVDQLFRQLRKRQPGNEITCCSYCKIYATSDADTRRLELALNEILAMQRIKESDQQTNSIKHKQQTRKCLCIVNAHLSAAWLNARLVSMMRRASPDSRSLVILIGESSPSSSAPVFDSDLLNRAQVKYWHDELSSDLASRFDQLMAYSASCKSDDADFFSSSEREKKEQEDLTKQLILFHIVCQELSKARVANSAGSNDCAANQQEAKISWKLGGYSFDLMQLQLALKILRKVYELQEDSRQAGAKVLVASNRDQQSERRRLLCYYLENVVYGPRMETLDDERTLRRLIETFIGSIEQSQQQLARFERLRANMEKAGAKLAPAQDGNMLAELIGSL